MTATQRSDSELVPRGKPVAKRRKKASQKKPAVGWRASGLRDCAQVTLAEGFCSAAKGLVSLRRHPNLVLRKCGLARVRVEIPRQPTVLTGPWPLGNTPR